MAQSAVPGVATLTSTFDPSAPRLIGPRTPETELPRVMPPHTILPPAEYARRKAVPGSARPPQPPQVEWSNRVLPQLPEVQARIPLADQPSITWEAGAQTVFQPPDPDVAVGPSDVIQVMNSNVNRFTKEGQRTDTVPLYVWFGGVQLAQACPQGIQECILFDPTIRYDQMHGRFIMTLMAVDFTTQRSHLLVSVSNGATYASGWKNWFMSARLDGTTMTANWADYPQFGFDHEAVYLSANMFSFSTSQFQYAKIRILKKADLYNTTATTLPYKDIINPKHEDGTSASTVIAPHFRGRTGIGSGAVLIAASDVVDADYLTLFRITDPLGATPTLARTTLKEVWKYNYPAPVPQLGTTVTLGSGDSRILKAVLRENVLWVAQTTRYTDQPVTATWTRIDLPTNKVVLQSRLTNGNFFFPTIDVPATVGTVNAFPNKLIAGTTTTPTGALTYAGVRDVKAGEDSFVMLTGGGSARWGDYFGTAIDPIMGGMWTIGQYAKPRTLGASNYGTWAAYFPWTTIQEFGDVPSTRSSFDFINVIRIWQITNGCADTPVRLYCPDAPIARDQMAVFLIRALYGDNFTFPPAPYFTDVPADHIFFKYVQKLRELGITSGCATTPTSRFCPTDPMTRESAAVFITKAKMMGLFGENFPHPTTAYFTDVPATHPAFKFVQKFREMGITAGCSLTEYCPGNTLTREQMAVFIARAFFN